MCGAALASGDFGNVVRTGVGGVDVAGGVDGNPDWVSTG